MIDIRPMTLHDFDALDVLLEEIHAYHVAGVPHIFRMPNGAPVIPRHALAEGISSPNHLVLLALDEARTVGFLWAYLRLYDPTDTAHPRRMVYVDVLGVSEAYRSQGLGRTLMDRAEAWGREQDASAVGLMVWAFNQSAIGFYEHLGYEVELLRMVKPLPGS